MLNFLGSLGSLLPGYIQGRRQAIADNWQDLQNYNNIQQGQLNNAFTEATWQPRLDLMYDSARRSQMNTIVSGLNTGIYAAAAPGMYFQSLINSAWAPALANYNNQAQAQAYNMALSNPSYLLQSLLPQGQQGANPQPSVILGS